MPRESGRHRKRRFSWFFGRSASESVSADSTEEKHDPEAAVDTELPQNGYALKAVLARHAVEKDWATVLRILVIVCAPDLVYLIQIVGIVTIILIAAAYLHIDADKLGTAIGTALGTLLVTKIVKNFKK